MRNINSLDPESEFTIDRDGGSVCILRFAYNYPQSRLSRFFGGTFDQLSADTRIAMRFINVKFMNAHTAVPNMDLGNTEGKSAFEQCIVLPKRFFIEVVGFNIRICERSLPSPCESRRTCCPRHNRWPL